MYSKPSVGGCLLWQVSLWKGKDNLLFKGEFLLCEVEYTIRTFLLAFLRWYIWGMETGFLLIIYKGTSLKLVLLADLVHWVATEPETLGTTLWARGLFYYQLSTLYGAEGGPHICSHGPSIPTHCWPSKWENMWLRWMTFA